MSKIVMIPIAKIIPDTSQPRKLFIVKELTSLMESIKKEGVRIPLLVESNFESDKFLILDGERRFRASKAAELTSIPCIVETGPLTFERRTQLRFNIQEQHANWSEIDKAKAIFEYKRATGSKLQEIADKLNMHLAKVHAYLSISDLSDAAQLMVAEKDIQFSYLTYLARIVKSYLELSPGLKREEIEEKMIDKIARNVFRTIPDIQNFSKTLQNAEELEIKLEFLATPEMSFYEYMGTLKMDNKEFTSKINKILLNLNFELVRAKEKDYRLYDEQFALFTEITNKMTEFESIQLIEQNKDESWGGL